MSASFDHAIHFVENHEPVIWWKQYWVKYKLCRRKKLHEILNRQLSYSKAVQEKVFFTGFLGWGSQDHGVKCTYFSER